MALSQMIMTQHIYLLQSVFKLDPLLTRQGWGT